jgi:phosphate/sulfate permease
MFIIGLIIGIGLAWKGSAYLTRHIGGVWTWTLITVIFVLSFFAPLVAGVGLLGLTAAAVAELFREHELKQQPKDDTPPDNDSKTPGDQARWN